MSPILAAIPDDSSVKVDLEQIDIFSQTSLQELQAARSERTFDFYICKVQENNHSFFFEASQFIQKCFLDTYSGTHLLNPSTRKPIGSFAILKAEDVSGAFQEIFNGVFADLEEPVYLPVLWNDHLRSDLERAEFYHRMGDHYRLGRSGPPDSQRALYFYEQGAKLGDKGSQCAMILLLQRKGDLSAAALWAAKYIEDLPAPSAADLILCADCCQNAVQGNQNILHNAARAFSYHHRAALLGNPYSIAKMIAYHEASFGTDLGEEQRKTMAGKWRDFIPEEWKNKSISSYLDHLIKIPAITKRTQALNFPQDLVNEKPLDPEPRFTFRKNRSPSAGSALQGPLGSDA